MAAVDSLGLFLMQKAAQTNPQGWQLLGEEGYRLGSSSLYDSSFA